jgi:D-inositol-3-phosphate glycosyltransferase
MIHAHYWTSGLAALAASHDLNLPVVETFHTIACIAQRHGEVIRAERPRLERAIDRTAAAVIAASESEHAELIRTGVSRHRLAIVPGGVDVQQFNPRGTAMRRGEIHRLLAVGSLAQHKGIETAISALARIPGAELVVAGGPPREDLDGDRAVHRLHILAKETGVDERVAFLGRVAHDDVPRWLRSADLTVSLPWDAPSALVPLVPLVPLESMACGVPVVVTAVGGHLDSVIDGLTGIHVPVRRPAEVARRIRALLADPTFRAALGIAGVDRAQSRYSWDRIARETLNIYQAVRREPESARLAR